MPLHFKMNIRSFASFIRASQLSPAGSKLAASQLAAAASELVPVPSLPAARPPASPSHRRLLLRFRPPVSSMTPGPAVGTPRPLQLLLSSPQSLPRRCRLSNHPTLIPRRGQSRYAAVRWGAFYLWDLDKSSDTRSDMACSLVVLRSVSEIRNILVHCPYAVLRCRGTAARVVGLCLALFRSPLFAALLLQNRSRPRRYPVQQQKRPPRLERPACLPLPCRCVAF